MWLLIWYLNHISNSRIIQKIYIMRQQWTLLDSVFQLFHGIFLVFSFHSQVALSGIWVFFFYWNNYCNRTLWNLWWKSHKLVFEMPFILTTPIASIANKTVPKNSEKSDNDPAACLPSNDIGWSSGLKM